MKIEKINKGVCYVIVRNIDDNRVSSLENLVGLYTMYRDTITIYSNKVEKRTLGRYEYDLSETKVLINDYDSAVLILTEDYLATNQSIIIKELSELNVIFSGIVLDFSIYHPNRIKYKDLIYEIFNNFVVFNAVYPSQELNSLELLEISKNLNTGDSSSIKQFVMLDDLANSCDCLDNKSFAVEAKEFIAQIKKFIKIPMMMTSIGDDETLGLKLEKRGFINLFLTGKEIQWYITKRKNLISNKGKYCSKKYTDIDEAIRDLRKDINLIV